MKFAFFSFLYQLNCITKHKFYSFFAGIGVNLDNSEPTTCINDIILQREDQLYERKLKKLSREQLLARILNAVERFMEDFQLNGPKNILTKYYKRWLHR